MSNFTQLLIIALLRLSYQNGIISAVLRIFLIFRSFFTLLPSIKLHFLVSILIIPTKGSLSISRASSATTPVLNTGLCSGKTCFALVCGVARLVSRRASSATPAEQARPLRLANKGGDDAH